MKLMFGSFHLFRSESTLSDRAPLFWGLLLMLLTTSLWALAFAAPLSLSSASAAEIALGRFIVYGLISLAALGPVRIATLPRRFLIRATVYALAGNIVYYGLLVLGIQLADAALAVLVIGLLPVTVSLFGASRADLKSGKNLLIALALFVVGVSIYNLAKTDFLRDLSHFSALGLACLLASLVMWTWYAVDNARFLKSLPGISAADWSSIIGVVSLGVSVLALPLSWSLGLARNPLSLTIDELTTIALWSVVLGAGSTWLGSALFNRASTILRTSILGQLIIFEAVFGIFYVFLFSGELPGLYELFGLSLALVAVWLSIRQFQRR